MWYHSPDTTYSTKAPADQLPCSRVKAPLNAGVNIYQNQLHDKRQTWVCVWDFVSLFLQLPHITYSPARGRELAHFRVQNSSEKPQKYSNGG